MKLKYTGIFSHMAKQTMESVVSSVYEYLSGARNNIPLHQDALAFGPQIEQVVTVPGLREFTTEDAEMARMVADDMAEMMQEAKEEMVNIDVFAQERQCLQQVEASNRDNFMNAWGPAKAMLQQQYGKKELDSDFYDAEFSNAMNPNASRTVMLESVKSHLTEQWAELLQAKQVAHEQKILNAHTQEFVNGLAGKINKMRQVRGELSDLIPGLGTLYSLISQLGKGKGKGKKIGKGKGKPGGQNYGGGNTEDLHETGFDVLAQFARILKGSSVEKLAETLGRQSQTEVEYEDEIFVKTLYFPEYKADFAAKSDITGIRESDDIGNMLSSEKVLLCDPALEEIFYKKFSEKKLHTYEYRGRYLAHREEHQEDKRQKVKENPKGPFIICCDTSGSMTFNGGLPELVAKTLTYAIVKVAINEKRKCYLINFSGGISTLDLSNVADAVTGLIRFLTMSFNGGTDVEPAFEEALRMLQMADYKRADVLVISDFIIGDLGEQTTINIANAQKNKTKFHSLTIGESANAKALSGFDTSWFYDKGKRGIVKVR